MPGDKRSGQRCIAECNTNAQSRSLPVGRIRYTLLLRDDGTVLNDATVWRTGEQAWLLFVGRREDLRHVSERAAGLDVRLDDRSGRFAVIALQGPLARTILAAVPARAR